MQISKAKACSSTEQWLMGSFFLHILLYSESHLFSYRDWNGGVLFGHSEMEHFGVIEKSLFFDSGDSHVRLEAL